MRTFFHLDQPFLHSPDDGEAGRNSKAPEGQEAVTADSPGLTDSGSKRLETLKAELEAVKKDSAGVLRGGGWCGFALYVRSAYRYFDTPSDRDGSGGFRVLVPAVKGPL